MILLFLEFTEFKTDKKFYVNIAQLSSFDDATINADNPKTRLRMNNGDELIVQEPVIRVCRMIVTARESDE